MQHQNDDPLYKIFYGSLIVGEASLKNLVNNSIREVLRKTKFVNSTVNMLLILIKTH
jgi:hypothetical protein